MKQTRFLILFLCMTMSGLTYAGTGNSVPVPSTGINPEVPAPAEMLQQILSITGLKATIQLKAANVLNIEAGVSRGKRYILYNPSFITRLQNLTKDKWAVMALLAHEVGHHLNGHTLRRGGSKPALELEADEFAGYILGQLGATLQQSQNVMNYIAKDEASSTHPSRSSRMLAIEKGWDKAAVSENLAALNDQ
jgi:hypothetical protein